MAGYQYDEHKSWPTQRLQTAFPFPSPNAQNVLEDCGGERASDEVVFLGRGQQGTRRMRGTRAQLRSLVSRHGGSPGIKVYRDGIYGGISTNVKEPTSLASRSREMEDSM